VRSEGRQWYDIQLFRNATFDYDIDLNISGINDKKDLSIEAEVLSVSDATSSFEFAINGNPIGDIGLPARPNGQYVSVGVERNELFSVDPDLIPDISNKLEVNLTYVPQSDFASGYLDFLVLQFARDLSLYGSNTFFRSLASLAHDRSTFSVGNVGSNAMVWDVTDPVRPMTIEHDNINGAIQFTTNTSSLREFVAFDVDQLKVPVTARSVRNQNILGGFNTEGLIVTNPAFIAQANRLAAFHAEQDGLAVRVVTTDEIYNEFSSGRQDLTAIRDYARYLYDNGGQRLKYLLLFGDCSFDYKKRFPIDHNFVPVYQARESLHPIFSYSSDDYFGFFEEDEGEWQESDRGDHTLEIGIGRLPAKTSQDATVFVDKIVRYSSDKKSLGSWRNNVFFVADDGDNNIHQGDAEKLATQIEALQRQFNPEKIYLDAFQQVSIPNGERSPATADKITDMIENGALIVNFTGHGNTGVWMDERVLNKEDIRNLSNRNKLAVFVTATCQFGQYDNPLEVSGGEELLLNPNGGAIALVTTTRPVFSNTNFVLNRAFYDAAFEGGLSDKRLGDILRVTKNTSLRGRVNRNFALLGDPMMRLNVPKYEIELDEISNVTNQNDTISALSLVRLTGTIKDQEGQQVTDFNGELTATIFDKAGTLRTLGDQNSPFEYRIRNTILFKGKATVESGSFVIEFIIPKNIAYNFDKGKIGLYAINESKTIDATGANIDVIVGGSASSVIPDKTAPEVELFMDNISFRSGDQVGTNPLLLAKL
ncbi:MAG: type IX secretion system sortase PorU, partial [Bacteroidota bacterium]